MFTMQFGKHEGKSAALLVLKEPDYVAWVLGKDDAFGRLAQAQQELERLVIRFNEKPFVRTCVRDGCGRDATRCSVYRGTTQLCFWCDKCDPGQLCPIPGKLSIIQSYGEAFFYVNSCCANRATMLKHLIREFAEAKGLPARAGKKQAEAFFA